MHCHMVQYHVEGFMTVFAFGERDDMPRLPKERAKRYFTLEHGDSARNTSSYSRSFYDSNRTIHAFGL
ncbi:hypothetical protein BV898_00716 [Hypsibius exemplaris]|uniref:Uncharacterized protein n=1 Tax=Hypsibius exemplaris TaxID=2072580 RepID=A0A1W0XEL1_HYPEX|nr:hypothetical protein BV898_00716 [Hypsibius exemplaris]